MKIWLFMLAIAITTSALADEQIPRGKKDCRIMHGGGTSGVTLDWSGSCKDGLAEGEGKLAHGHRADSYGDREMQVKVGAYGKPLSATVIGSRGKEIRKIAAYAVMLESYKPGLCAGIQCEMMFRYSVQMVGN